MAYPTDWDVDYYRIDDESEEHWKMRSSFMEKWKGNFPEDRLVCLAKVFSNIEFLGCQYPAEVMKLVADLSKEVATDYRESKKKKLQRTFVSASDAAEDRAKGTKKKNHVPTEHTNPTLFKKFISATLDPKPSNQSESSSQPISDAPTKYSTDKKSNWPIINIDDDNECLESSKQNSNSNYGKKRSHNSQIQSNSNNRNQPDKGQNQNADINNSNRLTEYGRLVLFDRPGNFTSKLATSCRQCKVQMLPEYSQNGDGWICSMKVNNVAVCSATALTQKESKEAACQEAWKAIQKVCHTIVIKKTYPKNVNGKNTVRSIDGLDAKVDSAIATRIMKMMGWNGGALGPAADGISEPIQPNLKQIRRTGLGHAVPGRSIRDALVKTIIEYAQSDTLAQTIVEYAQGDTAAEDLVFANDFTKEERALLHNIAQERGLKSKSYGKGENRYLVISRNMSPQQLVESLLNIGGSE